MNLNQLAPQREIDWFTHVGNILGFKFRIEADFAQPEAFDILDGRDELLYTITKEQDGTLSLGKWKAKPASDFPSVEDNGRFGEAHSLFERIIYEQVDELSRYEYRKLQEPEG